MSKYALTFADWRPYASGETITTVGTEATDMPASRLTDARRSVRARETTGTNSVGWQISFNGTAITVDCLSVLNYNADSDNDADHWIIPTFYSDDPPVTSISSETIRTHPSHSDEYNNSRLITQEADQIVIPGLETTSPTDLAPVLLVKSIKVLVFGNVQGYHQASHIAIGVNAWQPTQHTDLVQSDQQAYGVLSNFRHTFVADRRGNRFYVSEILLDNMTGDTAAAVFSWLMSKGYGENAVPFFCFPKPTKTQTAGDQMLYARQPADRGGLVRLLGSPKQSRDRENDLHSVEFRVMRWNELLVK